MSNKNISFHYVFSNNSVAFGISDVETGDKIGNIFLAGEYTKAFMKTFVQISFHFEFKVSELNATSSTAISRFWGRLLSGTVVPITLTITHHKTKFAFPMQIPKNMLGTTCHSDSNDVTSTATSLINNAKLKNIEFFANSETTCYSVYDITMDLNNIMPYYLELSDKESNVGCAYLYKGNSIVESSEFISIGCGNIVPTLELVAFC